VHRIFFTLLKVSKKKDKLSLGVGLDFKIQQILKIKRAKCYDQKFSIAVKIKKEY
jgi:hypothetical protein